MAVLWSILIGVALVCPLLSLMPNRLLAGVPFYWWQDWRAVDGFWLGALVLLGGAVFWGGGRWQAGAVLFALVIWLVMVGQEASAYRLLQSPLSRVGLASGFWGVLVVLGLMLLSVSRALGQMERLLLVGLVVGMLMWGLAKGVWDDVAVMTEYYRQAARFEQEFWRHVMLVAMTLIGVLVIGLPLGWWASRQERVARRIFALLNTLQTLPSLALFALLLAPLAALAQRFSWLQDLGVGGIGVAPAVVALVIYTLLPLTRNTFMAFTLLPESVLLAGRAMGMTRAQLWWQVSLPLALPVVLSGVRVVLVQAVGLTVVAALIGAGGLGFFIWQGLGENVAEVVLLGALPTIALALGLDGLMQGLIVLCRRLEAK